MLFTVIAFLVTLFIVAALAVVCVMLLAGPHSGIMPPALEPVVLALGWLAVLGLPAFVAYRVWRKLGRRRTS